MAHWFVKIPAGYWMAGTLTFWTKRDAITFTDRWNEAERNAGRQELRVHQDGKALFLRGPR